MAPTTSSAQAFDYQVCVIGGGPAGFAAASRAVDYGLRTLMIERDRLGGAGIFQGALASKTLWHLAKDYKQTCLQNRGYQVAKASVSFQEVVRVQRQALEERHRQLQDQIAYFEQHLGPERFRFLQGHGSLCGPHSVRVQPAEGASQEFSAETIVLATGSRPRKIGSLPIDEKIVLTSDGLEQMDHFPESMVVLGAGVIGCEYATIFSLFGQTEVRLIDKADRILPFEDPDISALVGENLEAAGAVIHRESRLSSMQIEDGRVKYVLENKNGLFETHYAEKALVSIGRVPNVEHLGCEALGIDLTDRGHFVVNDSLTNLENVYAVGDLTADICLVNVGENEGRHVIEKVYGQKNAPLSYQNVSTIMFLDPEVAGVGMNETQAQQAGTNYRVASIDFRYINRAIAMRCGGGFIKLLATDDDEMRLLGMRAIGPQASSAIQAIALLIQQGESVRALAELVHPHPSIVEGVQECVRMLLGNSILKPEIFPEGLRCCAVRQGKSSSLFRVSGVA